MCVCVCVRGGGEIKTELEKNPINNEIKSRIGLFIEFFYIIKQFKIKLDISTYYVYNNNIDYGIRTDNGMAV